VETLASAQGLPQELIDVLVALGLGAARAIPIVWMVPAFGGRDLPAPLRLGLGVLLASLTLPRLLGGMGSLVLGRGAGLLSVGLLGWGVLAAREVLVGATVGLVVSFAFRAAEAAGGLVDVARGANLSEVLAPGSGARTSPLGALYLLAAVVIFLELGGLGRLVAALARSYDAVPLGAGAFMNPGAAGPGPGPQVVDTFSLKPLWALVITASATLIESAVGLAAPVLVALLLADLALGAVARLTPAVPVYFAAMPLKALLGVGMVLLGLGALDSALVAGFPVWIRLAERAAALWAH
jgi:flagellar biosynthetic protein FliR